MNRSYKEHFITAGKIAKEVRAYGKSLLVPGASYNETRAKIVEMIHTMGAIPAFPPQIALDTVAAHYLVDPGSDHLFSTELIKLDIGVCYKGAIGDTAVTVDLSGKHQLLIDAVEKALLRAEQIIEVGLEVRAIGRVIHETIASFGLNPIENLAGHGLGLYKIHTPPTIPNIDNGSKALIRPGMTFAIEPFATDGQGLIYEAGNPTIFAQNKPLGKSPLHKKIASFNGLPFALHDLQAVSGDVAAVQKELLRLTKTAHVSAYGPLHEVSKGMVAQAENSVLVDDAGAVFITTR